MNRRQRMASYRWASCRWCGGARQPIWNPDTDRTTPKVLTCPHCDTVCLANRQPSTSDLDEHGAWCPICALMLGNDHR